MADRDLHTGSVVVVVEHLAAGLLVQVGLHPQERSTLAFFDLSKTVDEPRVVAPPLLSRDVKMLKNHQRLLDVLVVDYRNDQLSVGSSQDFKVFA